MQVPQPACTHKLKVKYLGCHEIQICTHLHCCDGDQTIYHPSVCLFFLLNKIGLTTFEQTAEVMLNKYLTFKEIYCSSKLFF